MTNAVSRRLQTWAGFPHRNANPHTCSGPCDRCLEAEVGERLAIQMGNEPVDPNAWKRAIEHLLERRRPGQRALAV
jgi:hypothetical protein